MMDKEKLHQLLSSLWKNDDSIGKTYYNQALQDVQTSIDLQEEPKKCMYSKDDYTDEDRKVLCDGCEEECNYSKSDDFTKALAECIHQAQGNVVDPMVLAETWKDELIKLAKSEEPVSKEWIKELRTKLDSLSKEDFKKVWAKYSRYGEEGSVDYNKLITMLNDALSKETKESWNKRLSEEHVSEGLEEEIDKYIKDHFTIDKEQLDRLGIKEKDYMYSMDKSDMLALVEHFINWHKTKEKSVSEDLEEASKEWLRPQLDKSYANYGEKKMMELTHFDGYAMLDAIEFGAQLQKQQIMTKAVDGKIYETQARSKLKAATTGNLSRLAYRVGDKVKVIIIKED